MNLTLSGHEDRYAVEQLLLSLFPEGAALEAKSTLHRGSTWLTATAEITLEGQTHRASRRLKADRETVRLRRQILQQSIYLAALPLLPAAPAWGALAGVRPTKLTTRHLLEGGSPKSAEKMLQNTYFVSQPRRRLAVDCSVSTVEAIRKTETRDLSLYIGIPFCPTRCAYCSFVSRSVGKKTELLEPYLQALLREIEYTGTLLKTSGYHIRSLYMGGGTPTTLSSPQMARLLDAIYEHLDLSRCLEFTVEGGRPDTLDEEKLQTIFAHGADRMSINPQSMVDEVLRASGRPHRAADILRAYGEATAAGFRDINMDLIAGLPGDDFEGFRHSLDTVAALNPSNITVHTLALKKAAALYYEKRATLPQAPWVEEMLTWGNAALRAAGYGPYYLYRQKYMTGSFENVGWCRHGYENLYNIYMMEELHSILSLGAGAMTKRVSGGTITRLSNPKYPQEYLRDIEAIARKKREVIL